MELTPEPRTKNDSGPDLKDNKQTKTFAFTLVDDSNPERRKKNRSIAHSHVKKTNRRTKHEQQNQTQEPPKKSVAVVVGDEIGEDGLEEAHAASARTLLIDSLTSRRLSSFAESLLARLKATGSLISPLNSLLPTIDLGFSTALDGCFGTQDPRTLQMIDHSIKVLWPGFMPGVAEGAYHPLSAIWFQAMCRSRALFHTVIVLGARHLDFLRKSTSSSDSKFILSHKVRAIGELRAALADPIQASSDENILALLWMASAEIALEDHGQASKSTFNPPLPSDQWVDAWANCVSGTEHSNMMRELIEMRGGLEEIGLFGVARVLSLATTILVTSRLVQPYHPFLEDLPAVLPNSRRFVDRKHISRIVLNNVTSTYTQSRPISGDEEAAFWPGFRGLIPLGLTEQALDVFRDMRGYSSLLEKYYCGEALTCTRMEMVDMRNAVQHRLVSLPLGSDRKHMTMWQTGIYECCHLTALLYACAVTFPLPTSIGWDRNLVRGIKQSLEKLSLENWLICCSDFHLWVLVLAGIAAFQKAERPWFVDKLRNLAWRKGLSDWCQVLPILKSFLWMDVACGSGGISLWAEVRAEHWRIFLQKVTSAP